MNVETLNVNVNGTLSKPVVDVEPVSVQACRWAFFAVYFEAKHGAVADVESALSTTCQHLLND